MTNENPPIEFILFIIVAAFIIFVIPIVRSIDLWKAIKAWCWGDPIPTYFELNARRFPKRYDEFLIKNDKYYRSLSYKRQRSFGSRVMRFIRNTNISGRDGLRINGEIVLTIAAAAVKITFGMRHWEFTQFDQIIVYPDEFYSKTFDAKLKGETNAHGIIVFSWKDLQFGVEDPNDAINLGYHEFAHALFIEHLMIPYEDEFKKHYRPWLMFIRDNDKLQEVEDKEIFRAYAAANEMEFFAVALENFFEDPNHFEKELPVLFNHLTKMLNQDPRDVHKIT
jgi:MtfA peptidase